MQHLATFNFSSFAPILQSIENNTDFPLWCLGIYYQVRFDDICNIFRLKFLKNQWKFRQKSLGMKCSYGSQINTYFKYFYRKARSGTYVYYYLHYKLNISIEFNAKSCLWTALWLDCVEGRNYTDKLSSWAFEGFFLTPMACASLTVVGKIIFVVSGKKSVKTPLTMAPVANIINGAFAKYFAWKKNDQLL